MTRDERQLLAALEPWARVPYGTPASRFDRTVVNCSTLTAHGIDGWLPNGLSTSAWLDVVVADGRRPWSPIERAVRDGWADDAPDGPVWTGVYLAQGWVDLPDPDPDPEYGHAFIAWYDGLCRVLEATNARHADGARFGVRWRGSRERVPRPIDPASAEPIARSVLEGDYPAGVRWCRLRLAA